MAFQERIFAHFFISSEIGPREAYKKGTDLVSLSPDVAEVFPDDALVNEALRSLMKIAQHSAGLTKRSIGSRSLAAPGELSSLS